MNDREYMYTKMRSLNNQNEQGRRRLAKRYKNGYRRLTLAFAVLLLLLVIGALIIYKFFSVNGGESSALMGRWYYDIYTEYEFDGRGNGCMCLDGDTHYEFTYTEENGRITLDFAPDYVTDCEYTYSVEGDKLTLVGGEGTAEIGKVYELTRG